MASRRSVPEAHLNNFWPRGEGKPFVFVDLVGEEGREHTGHRGKTKVGLESKFNKDEAKKIVSRYFASWLPLTYCAIVLLYYC